MKKNSFYFLGVLLCLFTNSYGQINFPDTNFKQALLTHDPIIDTSGNGEIEEAEALSVDRLNLDNKNISNLDGIQFFKNLEVLNCSDNSIKKIDDSQTSTLTKLRFLTARRNQISSVDVRNCALWGLRLEDNPIKHAYLTGPSTFQMEAQWGIYFDLDVIEYVCISNAQYMPQSNGVDHRGFWDRIGSALHIGECTIVTTPVCPIINFPDPNFKQALLNHTPVIDTDGDGEICIDEAEAIYSLSLSNKNINDITGINFFTNITNIDLSNNNLSSAGFNNNTKLIKININENTLASINVTSNTLLETLYVNKNNLSELNITKNAKLKLLAASQNQLTHVNLDENINLTFLHLLDNKLSTISVDKNTQLNHLDLGYNLLSQIDVTNNIVLKSLFLSHNNFSDINISLNVNLTHLSIDRNTFLTQIDISKNIKLYSFNAYDTPLKSIDISKNPDLESLGLAYTNITDLNITSNNSKLKRLVTRGSSLSKIDIRNCTSLKHLGAIEMHQLKELYLTGSHEFYLDLPNNLTLEDSPNISFVCVEPTYLSQTSNYIKNTLGYSNCNVVSDCTLPRNSFNLYFTLSPNPTTGIIFLSRKNTNTTATRADIFNAQTGSFIRSANILFEGDFLDSPYRSMKTSTNTFQRIDIDGPISLEDSAYIPVSDLPIGTYIFRVYSNRGTHSTNFIKM